MMEKSCADIVLRRLKELKWTKSDLARCVNVTPSRIRKLLQQDNITEHTLRVLFAALGLHLEYREIAKPQPPKYRRKSSKNMIIDGELV